MSEVIEVAIDHRLEEHLRAERLYFSRRSLFARVDKVVALALLVWGVVLVAVAGPRWWALLFLALAPLEYFHLFSIGPLVTKYRFKRNPKHAEVNRLAFSATQIHFRTPSIDSKIDWSLYDGLIEDDQLFLLTYGGGMYSVLPKRCFADPEAFRVMARAALRGYSPP